MARLAEGMALGPGSLIVLGDHEVELDLVDAAMLSRPVDATKPCGTVGVYREGGSDRADRGHSRRGDLWRPRWLRDP
jgi:hypothetical protein